jgi:hypothetical protein
MIAPRLVYSVDSPTKPSNTLHNDPNDLPPKPMTYHLRLSQGKHAGKAIPLRTTILHPRSVPRSAHAHGHTPSPAPLPGARKSRAIGQKFAAAESVGVPSEGRRIGRNRAAEGVTPSTRCSQGLLDGPRRETA